MKPIGAVRMKSLLVSLALSWAALAQESGVSNSRPRATPAPPGASESAQVRPEDRCTIAGSVTHASTGEPLRKAAVTLRRVPDAGSISAAGFGGPPASLSAVTNSEGKYTLTGIEPGKYRLMVERSGFVPQQFGAKAGATGQPGTVLTLSAAQNMKDADFRLAPQGVIIGRVLDEDGDPVQNVMVSCLRQSYFRGRKQWMPVNGQMTNDLGEYRIHSLAPGRYYVTATYRPGGFAEASTQGAGVDEGYAPTYYPSAASPEMASAVEVTAGSQLRGIDVRLQKTRTVRIRGRVVNGVSGKVAPNTMVRLTPRSETFITGFAPRMGRVYDAAGTFAIAGVTPGSYWLIAEVSEDRTRLMARMPIDVGTGSIDDITLTLSQGADLNGLVKTPEGAGTRTANVRIQLESRTAGMMGGMTSGASAKDDGTFILANVVPDAYNVRVFGVPEGTYVKSIRFGESDVTDSSLDFSQGVTPGLLVVSIATGAGQVDGSVENDKQQPAPGVWVVAVPEGARREHQQYYSVATSDQTGHYTLKGLVPGEYRIYALDQVESGAYQDPEFMKPFESKGEKTHIEENGKQSLQLKLISTGE